MTFRVLRDDRGQLLGAKCCHCPTVLDARTERRLDQVKRAHKCAAHYFARPREGV